MRSEADSDVKGHGDDYSAESDGPVSDEWRELNEDRAYWRRRFIILCAGVVALGVCAWLLPGVQQPSERAAAAASASMDALAKQQALPPAAHGPAWPGPSSTPNVYPTASTSSPGPTTTATSMKASSASGARHAKPTVSASPSPSASTAQAGVCAPANIVLSLFTSKPSYPKGAHPSFSVYAVSTSAAPCTLTFGAGAVQVVVTQSGHVMWDSAACKPAPAQQVRFTLGVPQVLTMAWDPASKQPAGCAGTLPTGAEATLDAVAMSHGQSSPVRSFKLLGGLPGIVPGLTTRADADEATSVRKHRRSLQSLVASRGRRLSERRGRPLPR